MHIYMYVYMYAHVYICVYSLYVSLHVFARKEVCVCLWRLICSATHTATQVATHTATQVATHPLLHEYTYAYFDLNVKRDYMLKYVCMTSMILHVTHSNPS